MSPTPSPDFEPGHIYDDPNLRKERDESGGLYVNTQTVLSSAEYQNAKEGLKKRESEISIQVDSGLGAEDKSWGGELINIKGKVEFEWSYSWGGGGGGGGGAESSGISLCGPVQGH